MEQEDTNKSDNVVEVKSTVEVLDANGQTMDRNTPLADIFNKIESGKTEGKSAAESIKDAQKAQPKTEEKKTEDAPVVQEDKKTEVSTQQKVEKKEEKTATPEEKKEDEVPESELQVLPHDKPKTAKRIQALLKRADSLNAEVTKTKAEAEAKAKELSEIQKKLTETKTIDPKLQEEIDNQKKELAMFRRRYSLDKDPEIKTRFDSRVESAEKSITDTLKKRGAGEELVKIIQEEGGWNKFSQSSRIMNLANGRSATASEIADAIMQQLPLGERRAIDAAMLEQIQTDRDKARYFEEEQAKATEYFKKQDELAEGRTKEQQAKVQETAAAIQKWHDETLAKHEWLKEKDIPATATAEQKAALEDENKHVKQLKSLLTKGLSSHNLDDVLDMVFNSVQYHQERRDKAKILAENKRLEAELKAKQSEIDRFKTGGRSTPRGGSISTSPSKTESDKPKGPRSLEEAFEMVSNGQIGKGGEVIDE